MTPTIEQLREWSAGLMGWEQIDPKGCKKSNTFFIGKTGRIYYCSNSMSVDWEIWDPLTDLNQAFMVAERMRELGWALHFHNRVDNLDLGVGFAREYSVNQNLGLYKTALAHAITLAAYATGEGR